MSKVWALVGRSLFWLSWPVLRVSLKRKQRSRVVIIADNKVLLVKGFIGSGSWILPGGGISVAETASQGAIREVREETGLELVPVNLREIGRGVASEYGLEFPYVAFAVNLPATRTLTKRRWELTDAAWLPLSTLARRADISPATRSILALPRPTAVCYTLQGK